MNIKEVRKNNTVRNLFPYLILVVIIGVTFLILSMGGTKVVNLFIMLKVN